MSIIEPYSPKHAVRLVTATSLFDGHDASINIMRRILQGTGVEVIHLGHNRSVEDIVDAAVQEDAQGVAITSYQGGHMEFFQYLRQRLDEQGGRHVRIFGGGGGTIVAREIEALHEAGIDRIFSPDDGRTLGLQGMINHVVETCDFDVAGLALNGGGARQHLSRRITRAELGLNGSSPTPSEVDSEERAAAGQQARKAPVIGITGTGGAGKSSLIDELVRRFLSDFDDKRIAVLCVDPTRRRTGGALLGDRIRFNSLRNNRVFMRSLATRGAKGELADAIEEVAGLMSEAFDLVVVETAGIGQGDSSITEICDLAMYVMTAEYGAPSQLEKIDMLDFADVVVINKFTRRGSEDALRDVRKQLQRNQNRFDEALTSLPVFGTSAAQFADPGVDALYAYLIEQLNERFDLGWKSGSSSSSVRVTAGATSIIPMGRERYLSDVADTGRQYRAWAQQQADTAADVDGLRRALARLGRDPGAKWQSLADTEEDATTAAVAEAHDVSLEALDEKNRAKLEGWDDFTAAYRAENFTYHVRGRAVVVRNHRESLSETQVSKVALPRFRGAGDRLAWRLLENVPGEFPFTSGVFPFKRQAEDPTRMFAGEGSAARTNRRFHYLADTQPAKRLSTAFDSLTLYGEDPGPRPDVYGKVGESGVSIFSVDEAEQLYAGFDLCDRATSVSMTINGPAPTILAFYFNAAIRQQCRRFLRQEGKLKISEAEELQPDRLRGATWEDVRVLLDDETYQRISADTLRQVRGTVQADILKEDQGQNTCIFSTEFALRLMGDVQAYFIEHGVRNFYSVSISGYHIAEAGANPIHQLAFTLANGFTYLEYYLARGMNIDDFAPNLSFFFSNGMDPEYSVIGRVARRIWSVAMRDRYGANERSQKLKYHIQTSGRSLHAQEIQFNDIRTTLQALLATYDNAQSLHTNAYDEAITTPTEESVRRAMAIQLIINKEFGLVFCENATQGSFIIEELTDLVEEAVWEIFDAITARGGVLGAMELQYQRGVIQDDSLKYEHLKHDGSLPIIGVNTFLPRDESQAQTPGDVALSRATEEEKQEALELLDALHARYADRATEAMARLQHAALEGANLFEALMTAATCCSLGQITSALYAVGGEYRRNL